MKNKILLAAVVVLGLVGCKPSDSDIINAVKEQTNRAMKDPTSSIFRDEAIYRNGDDKAYVCGEVNGKNEYGAYTGFKPFIANVVITKGGIVPLVDYADSYSYDSFAPIVCEKKSIEKAKSYIDELKNEKIIEEEKEKARADESKKNRQCLESALNENDISLINEKAKRGVGNLITSLIPFNRKIQNLRPDSKFSYMVYAHCLEDRVNLITDIYAFDNGAEIVKDDLTLQNKNVYILNKKSKEIEDVGIVTLLSNSVISERYKEAEKIFKDSYPKSNILTFGEVVVGEISF